jgi:hypothetical protein
MKIEHYGVSDELPDDWWAEAEMIDFLPIHRTYRVSPDDAQDPTFCEVCILDIAPLGPMRQNIGIFRDDICNGIPARERVLKILRGFKNGDAIGAVPVLPTDFGSPYKFRLTDGTHRLYCSLAAGFTHIPTIKGIAIDQTFG